MVFYVAFLLLLALISALLVICPCLVVIGQVFNMLCVFGISLKSSFEIFYLLLMKLLVCSDYFFFYSVECWESHGLINSCIWFWDIHLQFWFTKPSWQALVFQYYCCIFLDFDCTNVIFETVLSFLALEKWVTTQNNVWKNLWKWKLLIRFKLDLKFTIVKFKYIFIIMMNVILTYINLLKI